MRVFERGMVVKDKARVLKERIGSESVDGDTGMREQRRGFHFK